MNAEPTLTYTKHAREMMVQRNITADWVANPLSAPEAEGTDATDSTLQFAYKQIPEFENRWWKDNYSRLTYGVQSGILNAILWRTKFKMGHLSKYWVEKIALSKSALLIVAICATVGGAFFTDHIFHTRIAHFSLLLPFFFSGYIFLNAKIVDYKFINGHIKIVGLGLINLADLPVENISKVESVPPFSTTYFRKKTFFVYRLGSSLGQSKVITMRDGRVFAITPDPGSEVDIALSLKT